MEPVPPFSAGREAHAASGHEFHRAIVEQSPDGFWVFDLEGRILHANPRVARMFGATVEEMAGLTVFDTLDEPGREQFAQHLVDLRAGRFNDHEVEVQFVRRDGTAFWVLAQENPLRAADGSLLGVVHRMSDDSRRRHEIRELQRSREQLAEAQRIALVGSWEWDVAHDRISTSDHFLEMFGFTADDYPRSVDAFLDLVHPDDRLLVQETIVRAVESGGEFGYLARVRTPQGWHWAQLQGVVHEDAGSLTMAGTLQDVTEMTEAQLALQEQARLNELLRQVASAANEAETLYEVLRLARPLVVANQDWARAQAFALDSSGRLQPMDLPATEPGEPLPPPGPGDLALARRAFDERATVWDDEARTVACPVLSGGEVRVVLALTAVRPRQRLDLIRSMIEQVAAQVARVVERERARRELADARDQAMAASRQKSEFLATMSHEIRTPLNGIIGLTDLLASTPLDLAQQRLVNGVEVSGRALLALINDVLDFSKIEAGRLQLEEVDFEVRQVFDQTARILAEQARGRDLELLVSCAPSVPSAVRGDPTRLSQVLVNLGSNAVKFTDSGTVAIHATAEPTPDGALLRVEVRDTGSGIEPERLPALFEPFTQGDASTTRMHGGTGLGLAISREIVHALDGEISAQSTPGVGSRFSFTMPLGRPQGTASGAADARARTLLAGVRSLVLDDHAERGERVAEQLRHWGMDVSVAAPGQEPGDAGGGPAAAYRLQVVVAGGDAATAALRQLVGEPGTGRGDGAPALVVVGEASMLPADAAAAIAEHALVAGPPVLSAELRDAVVAQLGGSTPAPRAAAGAAPAPGLRRRILVVEDNPVNQLVAAGLLEARGYRVETADDGAAAVAAFDPARHDAILMDVQMPRLDGYAATREIRSREPAGTRVPVIAMTASAVEGERERCLAAGMDDFLTKPVDPGVLGTVLARWLPAAAEDAPSPTEKTDPTQTIDQENPVPDSTPAENDTLLAGLDQDRLHMLRDLDPGNTVYLDRAIGNFCTNTHTALETITAAVEQGDAAALRQAAHKLAGSALNLGVVGAGAAARELEFLGDAGTTEGAEALLPPLAEALETGRAALRAYQAVHTDAGREAGSA